MLVIESAALSDVGRKRKGNEDSFCVDDRIRLYVVADGMGGHKAGEIASRLVVETLHGDFASSDGPAAAPPQKHPLSSAASRLMAALHHANRVVFDASRADAACEGMGSTVSAVHYDQDRFIVANVGDSPVYLVRDGRIRLVSKMHTYMAEQQALAGEGARTLSEQFRHLLTRAMGTKETVEPDASEMAGLPGDTVVISSDGLTDMVKPQEILTVVTRVNPQRACRLLVDLANKRGGNDNITVIVLRLRQPSAAAAAPKPPSPPPPLRVDFDTADDSHQGMVLQLDADSVFIETAEPFSEGQKIVMSIPLADGSGSTTLTGRVVSRDSLGIFVRFTPPMTASQQAALAALFR